jgi:AraC-like DNA-binding protein
VTVPTRIPVDREATISYQIVGALIEAIGGHPGIIEEGLRRFGLNDLDTSTARVPLRSFVDLFEWLAATMQRPSLGLELSERGGPQTVGTVGYLFLESRTLEAALTNLGKYLFAVQEGSRFYLEVDGEYAFVDYGITEDHIINRQQDSEYSIGSTWNLIKQFAGHACQLTMVEFEHDKAEGSDAILRRVFNAPVLFRRRANRLHFRTSLLETPSRSGDPFLFPILESHIRNSISELTHADSFTEQVRRELTHESLGEGLRARDIAARLGISEATLHRRLGKEDISFKKLHDATARSFAELLISHHSLPIATIANRLGFSETAALTRAFHRWYGMSPRDYRKNLAG